MKFDRSPWGKPESVTVITSGIWKVTTASHGGYKLDASRNKEVPELLRASGGWYEEDEVAAIVHYCFREFFPAHWYAGAVRTLKSGFWKQWEALTGSEVDPSESAEKRKYLFYTKHANDLVTIGEAGRHDDPSKVIAAATVGGRREGNYQWYDEDRIMPHEPLRRYFEISSGEWSNRDREVGIVIDSSRHEELV